MEAQAARRRQTRWIVRGLAAVALLVPFALAGAHAVLVSGQDRLDHLESDVDAARARYAESRLQVAELEAPERIVREAKDRLGMVQPDRVIYLSPDPALVAAVGGASDGVGSGDASSDPAPTPDGGRR
jgi:cell division protein FtsB